MSAPSHSELRQAVMVHGVACVMSKAPDGYRLARTDTGAEVSRAETRFHAVAKAAATLHTAARSATQGA